MNIAMTQLQDAQAAVCRVPGFQTPPDQEGLAWVDPSDGMTMAELPWEKMTPLLKAIEGTLAGELPDAADVAFAMIHVGKGVAVVPAESVICAIESGNLPEWLASLDYQYMAAFDKAEDGA